MTTPDRPDWTVGNVAVVTGQTLYDQANIPAGTSTGKINLPGAGRLYIPVVYAYGAGASQVGQVTVDQYADGVLMSTRTILLWADTLYQVTGEPEVFILPVEGQQVDITYGPSASDSTYDTTVTWSSAPIDQIDTICNSGPWPGTLWVADNVNVAAGAFYSAYIPPVARAVSVSVSGAAGKFNATLSALGPNGLYGEMGSIFVGAGIPDTVTPFVAAAPLVPLLVNSHNTDTVAHGINIAVTDAS